MYSIKEHPLSFSTFIPLSMNMQIANTNTIPQDCALINILSGGGGGRKGTTEAESAVPPNGKILEGADFRP